MSLKGPVSKDSIDISCKSQKDEKFDAIIGDLEDLLLDDEFVKLQNDFYLKYYDMFEDTEENKLAYTPVFMEYV
jgi:ADP-ribosylation factor 2-binding protein